MLVFFTFCLGELKVVNPLKIYQHTKCHSPMLTGASFASTSEGCH